MCKKQFYTCIVVFSIVQNIYLFPGSSEASGAFSTEYALDASDDDMIEIENDSDFLDTFAPDITPSRIEKIVRYLGAPLLKIYRMCQVCITSMHARIAVFYAAFMRYASHT